MLPIVVDGGKTGGTFTAHGRWFHEPYHVKTVMVLGGDTLIVSHKI